MKLYYFFTLKSLWDGHKLSCIMECPGLKKQLSGKKSKGFINIKSIDNDVKHRKIFTIIIILAIFKFA